MTSHDSEVRRADTEATYEDALSVRRRVFVDEQGVPEELEVDEFEADATHFVAYDASEAVSAARLRRYDDDSDVRCGKVERVAVLADRRGEGWGARLMDEVEATADAWNLDRLVLHAQTAVEGFYTKRGYRTVGEEFVEADIPHVKMVLDAPFTREQTV